MICKFCEEDFRSKRKNMIYCTVLCRRRAGYAAKNIKRNNLYIHKIYKDVKCNNTNCNINITPISINHKYCKNCSDIIRKVQSEKYIKENNYIYKKQKNNYSKKVSTKLKKIEDYNKINGDTKEQSILENIYKSDWNSNEDLFLLENWNKLTKEDIAKQLNRTYAAVHSRYKKIAK